MKSVNPNSYSKVVILTGAGVSASSGLGTYRGPGGLWNDESVVKFSMAETWATDPLGVWEFFAGFRTAIAGASPNPAHEALMRFGRQSEASGGAFTIVTQNIDGLHQQAGSERVVEVHGNVCRTRCEAECGARSFADMRDDFTTVPRCPECGAQQRPDIVLFGEMLPVDATWAVKQALRGCDLFVAIGTSGTVSPAANYVRSADYEGARTVLLNLDPMIEPNPYFHEEYLGPADELVPQFFRAG